VKIKMGDRLYQGVQWDGVLEAGGEYEVPAAFGKWLVDGDFATEVKAKAKGKGKVEAEAKVEGVADE